MLHGLRESEQKANAASTVSSDLMVVWGLTFNRDLQPAVNSAGCPMMPQTPSWWMTRYGITTPLRHEPRLYPSRSWSCYSFETPESLNSHVRLTCLFVRYNTQATPGIISRRKSSRKACNKTTSGLWDKFRPPSHLRLVCAQEYTTKPKVQRSEANWISGLNLTHRLKMVLCLCQDEAQTEDDNQPFIFTVPPESVMIYITVTSLWPRWRLN